MPFDRTQDIIEHAVSFHRLLANYFDELSRNTVDQRLKLLLDYLKDQETTSSEKLRAYSQTAPHKILDTWFQFTECEEKLGEIKKLLIPGTAEADAIIETLLTLYDCFITQFRSFAQMADSDDVRAVFENIAAHEEQEKHNLIRNSNLLFDI